MLPATELDEHVRDPLGSKRAQKVLEHLRECPATLSNKWKTRKRKNQERLASGDPYELCQLIKGLIARSHQRPLANSDRIQLSKATEMLSLELAHALGKDPEKMSERLEAICEEELAAA